MFCRRRSFFRRSILSISRRLVHPEASAQAHQMMAKPNGKSAPHQGSLATKLTSRVFSSNKIAPKTTRYMAIPYLLRLQAFRTCVNHRRAISVKTTVAQHLLATP